MGINVFGLWYSFFELVSKEIVGLHNEDIIIRSALATCSLHFYNLIIGHPYIITNVMLSVSSLSINCTNVLPSVS